MLPNILVKKDDGTDVTFLPDGINMEEGWRTNVSGVSSIAQLRLSVLEKKVTSGANKGKTQVSVRLSMPLMEVIPSGTANALGYQPGASVADTEVGTATFYFSDRGTNETRADLVRMLAHALSGAGATTAQIIAVGSVTADVVRDAAITRPIPYKLVNLLDPSV